MAGDRYLLDTHTLIWWWLGDPTLSRRVIEMLSDREDPIYVSAVAAIEIALEVRGGKLPAMAEPLSEFDEAVTRDGFVHLPIDYRHARRAGLLQGEHRDPFDRLIAAQALGEDLTVITRDREIAAFGCDVIW